LTVTLSQDTGVENKLHEERVLYQATVPILIVSSCAGGGNYSVGEALKERLAGVDPRVHHVVIEELLSKQLVRSNFGHHYWICRRAPFMLKLTYGFPFLYLLKLTREKLFENKGLDTLRKNLLLSEISTVIATNHRAAFWISSLKHRRQVQCSLWGVVTDYRLSPGWKYLFQDQLDRLLGPVPAAEIPHSLRPKYCRINLPVSSEYSKMCSIFGDKNQVLVTGGAWGLGPLKKTVQQIRKACPEVRLHVVCGSNEGLFCCLQRKYTNCDEVVLYRSLPSLELLMKKCAVVITRPGGVTMTEAYQAGRKIFLLQGQPVIEARNMDYALRNFSATLFSIKSFQTWYNNEQ